MRGVSVIRNASFPIVMFPIFGDLKDIRLIDCHINGVKSKFPKGYCHAIQVGVGTVSGLQLKGLRVTDCNFGLFQANNATGTLKAVRVEQCVFEKNLASDLEFNSPKGKMSDVLVRNCVFRDNLSKSAGAGFAVGFANVKDATVEHCIIENYGSEALHVEDHSSGIRLSRNLIRGGSLKQNNGVIMVLSSSSKVSIDSNVIDARPNENRPHLILVTAGGQQFKNPSEVEVTNNILVHGPSTRTCYLQPGSGPKPTGNIISAFKDGTE